MFSLVFFSDKALCYFPSLELHPLHRLAQGASQLPSFDVMRIYSPVTWLPVSTWHVLSWSSDFIFALLCSISFFLFLFIFCYVLCESLSMLFSKLFSLPLLLYYFLKIMSRPPFGIPRVSSSASYYCCMFAMFPYSKVQK